MSIRFQACAFLCAASVLAATGAVVYTALAGPLTPPAGPVTGTYKTLSEVEPRIAISAATTPGDNDASPSLFKITQPGSYYLTGNTAGVVGKHGIEITASGVTLDLGGFDLAGVAAMGAFDGVSVTAIGLTNIAVLNGSVRNWGDEGVDLASVGAVNSRVERVLASGNAGFGIFVGPGSTVTNCTASLNGTSGILTGTGSTVSNCSASSNASNGISISFGSLIANCSANNNSSSGISAGAGSAVNNCSAYQNTGSGISTGSGSTVSNCTVYQNTGSGMSVASGSTAEGCTARGNTLDGIVCTASCVIRGNACSANGSGGDGAGIHATGTDNRIEGNNCTTADRGMDIGAFGNIIIRNTCSGNATNWVIVANNVCGPILDRTAPGSAAISGNSAPSSLGSTDPNANFSY